ncbi:MAG: RNA-binding cell elongation regulator Jag/EloR [Armatimonadota bacterium]|nr:RNA-binding cell elongation regulator Jag/EloR [Armatimonadota bacterium]
MTAADGTGRTIDEAVENALRQIGATRDEVEVEVLQEPKPALLGFGGREARVRVTRRPTAVERAKAFLDTTIGMMGYRAAADVTDAGDRITVSLKGRDVGPLIGRHGRTLDALEILLAIHLQRALGRRVQVTVDAAGYRARREQALVAVARRAAERAVAGQTVVALDPMEPRERRIVHLALKDDSRVETTSEGEAEHRHVVVRPKSAGESRGAAAEEAPPPDARGEDVDGQRPEE